ncbi:MAG: hypothetical protein MUO63_22995 [Desulfobulbaceae bacterium]|nr:hypothetical protein [Desulfobulbaceae bacterium]
MAHGKGIVDRQRVRAAGGKICRFIGAEGSHLYRHIVKLLTLLPAVYL